MQIYFEPGSERLKISQKVLFENAQELLDEWTKIAQTLTNSFVIDCEGLEHADSSFLAFLIEVKRECLKRNLSVSIASMPRYLHGCIRTYGLEDIFPIGQEYFSSDEL